MASGPGRDQRAPMERLVRIAAVLHAHGDAGVSAAHLNEVAGFDPSSTDQLAREVRHLNSQGWQIVNVAPQGAAGHYRMATVDNRLAVRLTPAQQGALQRAVLLADRDELVERLGLPASARPADIVVPSTAPTDTLSRVMSASGRRCLLRFTYNGSPREVHPASVRAANGTWYLRGRETGGDVVKTFVVSRMSDVSVDAPGSADAPATVRHPGLHPMTWELDDPVEVTLRTTPDYAPDVRRWLGTEAAKEPDGEHVVLRYRVTNRSAFRTRLYELGRRVDLVGPEEVRREVLAELAVLAGGDA